MCTMCTILRNWNFFPESLRKPLWDFTQRKNVARCPLRKIKLLLFELYIFKNPNLLKCSKIGKNQNKTKHLFSTPFSYSPIKHNSLSSTFCSSSLCQERLSKLNAKSQLLEYNFRPPHRSLFPVFTPCKADSESLSCWLAAIILRETQGSSNSSWSINEETDCPKVVEPRLNSIHSHFVCSFYYTTGPLKIKELLSTGTLSFLGFLFTVGLTQWRVTGIAHPVELPRLVSLNDLTLPFSSLSN